MCLQAWDVSEARKGLQNWENWRDRVLKQVRCGHFWESSEMMPEILWCKPSERHVLRSWGMSWRVTKEQIKFQLSLSFWGSQKHTNYLVLENLSRKKTVHCHSHLKNKICSRDFMTLCWTKEKRKLYWSWYLQTKWRMSEEYFMN